MESDCDQELTFLLKYAALCVSDNDIAIQVEEVSPLALGCVFEGKLSVVERLLSCCR